MKIAGIYSFKNGKEVVEDQYPSEFSEIVNIIHSIDSETYRTKISREKNDAWKKTLQSKRIEQSLHKRVCKAKMGKI